MPLAEARVKSHSAADDGRGVAGDVPYSPKLLERSPSQARVADAFREAASGAGRIVLVSGEAGIGKTTLVESFLAAHRAEARILLGRCDALSTPEPLGSLYDIAHQAGGALLN